MVPLERAAFLADFLHWLKLLGLDSPVIVLLSISSIVLSMLVKHNPRHQQDTNDPVNEGSEPFPVHAALNPKSAGEARLPGWLPFSHWQMDIGVVGVAPATMFTSGAASGIGRRHHGGHKFDT
ncbi:hypothetical protein AOLI_G00013200 [Acnodon oligacanthus]